MTSSHDRHDTRAARRNVVWGMSSLSVLVLLFGYHTSTEQASAAAAPATGTTSGSATRTTTGTTGASSSATSSTSTSTSTSASSSTAATTVTGQAVPTRYGPVQVQLTVTGGKVTAVDVLQRPDSNGRDQEINARALPILVSETLSAQSAQIDMVSGATYTSDGYTRSLQSALDQAGIA
ncbi:FMN-binding protein [Quadrisphaera oryzae]|uniref:FMN-binding protein n=1 Tax=Quadrisphaera TaxID=317661 RepID=UPI0016451F02|nr:FMN-binding protein [Quadrisphaera sp. RL12-1S]MBC3763499.1 FMN-binding protein [Quadrisphaera sp. RL12-1S]